MELVYLLLRRKAIIQYDFFVFPSLPSVFVTKYVRFSFVLINLWNIVISYKKVSTNSSYLFVKSQKCGVKT